MFSSLEKAILYTVNISELSIEVIIRPKMNADNDNREQAIDLGLALGYSNHDIERALNNDSGAGANAGSRVDMTFVATDPLSELVWSPHKGLSLKCADSSATEKRPSLLWGAGPGNMILSPPQGILVRRTNPGESMDEGNMVGAQAALHVKSGMGETAMLACSRGRNLGTACGSSGEQNAGTSGNNEEMMAVVEASALDINKERDQIDKKEKGIKGKIFSSFAGVEPGGNADSPSFKVNDHEPNVGQIEPSMELNKMIRSNPIGGIGDNGSGNQTLGMEAVLNTEVLQVRQYKTPDTPMLNSTSECGREKRLALVIGEESKNEMKTPGSTSTPLEKLESTDENDLWPLPSENACGAVNRIRASESAHAIKMSSHQDEGMLHKDKSLPVKNYPKKSRIYGHRRKEKGKALSDGDVGGRMSKEEEDSDESVESCNSAGLFSAGKKRLGFGQQLVTCSKRIRKQIHEGPGSTSFVRQDSSFMSWISNMMKGLSKSNQDEAPSLALTLAHPNQYSYDQKFVRCYKNQDPGGTGFQSIFQSLYYPAAKVEKSKTLKADNQTGEESKEIDLANKLCDVNISPVACYGENRNFKKFLLSNEKFNQSTSGNGEGTSTQPRVLSGCFAANQENCKTNCLENRSPFITVSGTKKDGVSSSSSSLGKRKTNSAENNDSNPPSEGKTTPNFGCKNGLLGSLWVTRFSSKSSSPILKLDQCRQSTVGATKLTADCMGLIPHSQNRFDSFKSLKILETREYCTEDPLTIVRAELQNCASDAEASFEFRRNNAPNDQKSICKVNPILPSQRFKSSEAMASLFARRLDVLKHIIKLNETDNESHAIPTCFFCGTRGHGIHDCSEIMETELEDLLRSNNSYVGAEESPCFCIRCFQLNHWAVACPSISKRRNRSEYGASLVNRSNSSKLQQNTGNKKNQNLMGSKESPLQVATAFGVCGGRKPTTEVDCSVNQKSNGNMTSVNLFSNSNLVKKNTSSSSGEIESKENQIIPFCNFVNRQISDVPEGIFDAIKRLRLSRGDILKWMNSVSPFSLLDGFFLRLRLGKWEEGLGGTGYYVACISGPQKERSLQGSKNPISVDMGGIKCLVKSQYISNHDFLKDELMAWWGATTKAGGKIPSEEDLKVKLEEKKKLGL